MSSNGYILVRNMNFSHHTGNLYFPHYSGNLCFSHHTVISNLVEGKIDGKRCIKEPIMSNFDFFIALLRSILAVFLKGMHSLVH